MLPVWEIAGMYGQRSMVWLILQLHAIDAVQALSAVLRRLANWGVMM